MKLFRKTAVWLPTFPGLLILAALFVLFVFLLFSGLYSFLATSDPRPDARVLILEGWMGDEELANAISLADSNTLFVAAGGPIEYGAILFAQKTYADFTAIRLEHAGIPAQRILVAPAPWTKRDRTYTSALAVREKMKEAGLYGLPVNLVSVETHCRRSYFLYRRVFGSDAPVGVVSLKSRHRDLRHWWRSSSDFKLIITELLSWVYVQLTRWKYG